MIEFCCKALFATRVMWRRIRTANVATDDPTRLPQFCQCPLKIDNREATALPIRYRLFHAQTIEIDCDVNIFPGQIIYKLLKALAPIVAKNRARPLPVFLRTIVCPGMHFEPAGAFGAPVPENLMWPPAFKVTATPNDLDDYRTKQGRLLRECGALEARSNDESRPSRKAEKPRRDVSHVRDKIFRSSAAVLRSVAAAPNCAHRL